MRNASGLRQFAEFLLGVSLFCASLSATAAEYSGMVWKRQGEWHVNGSSSGLRLGEAIPPGGLLTGAGAGPHSLVVLLPDGQRLLCECYETRTCAQGFRVPAIPTQPGAAEWTMFAAVRNTLLLRPANAEAPFPAPVGRDEDAANVETVTALHAAGRISIATALRVLPAGHYSLDVRGDGPQPGGIVVPSVQPLDWEGAQPTAEVRVPGRGLYRITVVDETHVPRMEIELLATPSDLVASETDGLKKTRLTVIAWNRAHEGWSLHDFLRVYLQSRAIAPPE